MRALTFSCLLFATPFNLRAQQISVRAEVQQGTEALQQGNLRAAEEHFVRALANDPSLAEVRANLGLAYYAEGKYPQAVEAFRQALKQRAALQTAQTFLPLSLAALDHCGEAIPGLRRQFSSHPDVKLRRILGLSLQRCLIQTGKQADADQVTQQLLAQYPEDLDVLYEAGQMYGKLSSDIYLRLMKVAPHSARGYQLMGQVAAAEGDWQKAVDAYRQAIQLDSRVPGVRLALAVQLLLHSSDPDAWKQALENLNEELKINPHNGDAHYEVGEVYRKHGEPEQAIAAFRHALESRPTFVEARLGLAKLLHQQRKPHEALALLEPARAVDPGNAAIHFVLGQIYRELGRAADAEREEADVKQLQTASPPDATKSDVK